MYALAVDIGGTKIAGAIVHRAMSLPSTEMPIVVEERRVPTPACEGGEAVFTAVSNLLAELKTIAQSKGLPLVGCAVSAAGVIDPQTGAVAYASSLLPGWAGIQLRERLEQELDLPVKVVNDVHAHGLGEASIGVGQAYDSVLVVAVGTGLGAAFVNHGQLMMGNSGVAGSIAHMLHPVAAGMVCACGSTLGHIECIASGTGKQLLYNRDLPPDHDPVTEGVEVTRRAESGEQYAQEILTISGGALGATLASAAALLDPAAIVITGSAAQSGIWWWEGLRNHFAHNALSVQSRIPLLEGALGSHAPLIGATSLL